MAKEPRIQMFRRGGAIRDFLGVKRETNFLFKTANGYGKVMTETFKPGTQPNKGTVDILMHYKEGSVEKVFKQTVYVSNISGGWENFTIGRTVKGSSVKIRETVLRFNGLSRVENGFSTLMEELRAGGISPEIIQDLYNQWDFMSESDKIKFFSMYHFESQGRVYSSDAIADLEHGITAEDYLDIIETALDEVREGNVII